MIGKTMAAIDIANILIFIKEKVFSDRFKAHIVAYE